MLAFQGVRNEVEVSKLEKRIAYVMLSYSLH